MNGVPVRLHAPQDAPRFNLWEWIAHKLNPNYRLSMKTLERLRAELNQQAADVYEKADRINR